MSATDMSAPADVAEGQLRTARRLGVFAMGLILGFALLPAILELVSLAGNVTAFKYQNF